MNVQKLVRIVVVACVVLRIPVSASAQSATAGGIAGVVKDTSGAVLPGVTVEAASPALIERVRSVVTDDQGNYKILALRPGAYTVTFTLPGFATFKREGIELSVGFTATANAEMKVGGLEETITVSGASPVVDVQNVRTQNVLERTVIDALPNNRSYQAFASLTLGATTSSSDVGGNKGDAPTAITIHGGIALDGKVKIDGMNMNIHRGNPIIGAGTIGTGGGGQQIVIVVNQMAMQETVLETSGVSPESETGNVQVNYVPKEGGNKFRSSFFTNFANSALQGENLTDEIRARGLTLVPQIDRVYDVGVGVGGPIKQDTLWFYEAWRRRYAGEIPAGGAFPNLLPRSTLLYAPDLSQPSATGQQFGWVNTVRVTWQAAAKHKIAATVDLQQSCICSGVSSINAPEAATDIVFGGRGRGPSGWAQATWNYAASNRLLFEAGTLYMPNKFSYERGFGTAPSDIAITDVGTGIRYNAGGPYKDPGTLSSNFNGRFSVAYVTGSHAFKTGLQALHGRTVDFDNVSSTGLGYTFRNGVPLSITQYAFPLHSEEAVNNIGIFGQDQWTMRKLTLNYGLRFDYLNGSYSPTTLAAAPFRPAADFPGGDNLPNWTDLSPRLGAAYDVFGNGKTALKASFGRYVQSRGSDFAQASNPVNALVTSTTRTWGDANGNLVPDCVLTNFGINGECGAVANSKFGTVNITSHIAPDVNTGFGVRDYNWQTAVAVQQELRPGMALNVGYFRTSFKNVAVSDNLAVTAADFSQFCITAPVDARLPGGGGNQICGLYDVNPAKFGQVDYSVTQTSNFGNRTEVFNGVDLGINARFGRGGLMAGGFSFGRTETNACFAVDSPQGVISARAELTQINPGLRPGFCNVTKPWWDGGGQAKFNVVYPLPWDMQASAVYQNLPGAPILADFVATNAQIAPTLGRNLAAGAAGTATIPLIAPFAMFEKRLNQLDLRFAKTLRVGRTRVQGMLDIYNVTNTATILAINTAYGAAWLRPTGVLAARVFKFGAQFDF